MIDWCIFLSGNDNDLLTKHGSETAQLKTLIW